MRMTAFRAKEIAMSAKPSDISLDVAYEKILQRAKSGYMSADVSVEKNHVDDVLSQLSANGYDVRISQTGVYYDTINIGWE